MTYISIYLHGFRATGKSTAGKILAEKIGWKFVEMDDEIVKAAGMPIVEITKKGTTWQEFRSLEQKTLLALVQQKNIVVSTGGGAMVNSVINEKTGQQFGVENTEILKSNPDILSILFTAEDEIIENRIREIEMASIETKRPILNEKVAVQIQTLLEKYSDDPLKQKEITVDAIVKDSMEMYTMRKPLYAALTEYLIDTSHESPEQSAERILKMTINI